MMRGSDGVEAGSRLGRPTLLSLVAQVSELGGLVGLVSLS